MAKHDWYTHTRYGEDVEVVDVWRMDDDIHNGPECRRCGEIFCEHCEPECYEEECPSAQMELF